MPKQQLKFPKAIGKQLKVAAQLNGLKFENSKPIGDFIYSDVTYTVQGLVDTLLMVPDLKGDELDEPKEEKKKEGK